MTIHKEFNVYALNQTGIDKTNLTRDLFDYTLNHLITYCANGREFALARTKLEEACYFACKAISVDTANQLVTPTE